MTMRITVYSTPARKTDSLQRDDSQRGKLCTFGTPTVVFDALRRLLYQYYSNITAMRYQSLEDMASSTTAD